MDRRQQLGRIIKAIDQIGCKDEVITCKERFEITCITLIEHNLVLDAIQTKTCQRTLPVKNKITFIRQGIAQYPLRSELGPLPYEAGGKIDAGYFVKLTRQLESRPSGSAAKVECFP